MAHPLDGIEAKIVRAGEHLKAIGEECEAFINAGTTFSVTSGYEADRRAWVQRIKVLEQPPLRLGVLVGDFVHNVRCALDHLAFALTELDGGVPDRFTQFPIATSKSAFDGMAARRIPALTPEHRALIERAQPFSGSHGVEAHPLTWLQELSNADKHHVVQTTYLYLGDQRWKPMRYQTPDHGPSPIKRILVAEPGTQISDGSALVILEFADHAEVPVSVDLGGKFRIDVAFGDRALSWEHLPTLLETTRTFVTRFIPEFTTWT